MPSRMQPSSRNGKDNGNIMMGLRRGESIFKFLNYPRLYLKNSYILKIILRYREIIGMFTNYIYITLDKHAFSLPVTDILLYSF